MSGKRTLKNILLVQSIGGVAMVSTNSPSYSQESYLYRQVDKYQTREECLATELNIWLRMEGWMDVRANCQSG